MADRTVGDLAIVLHSHMPYVEGFGTYPFGEEWLFDAFARSHLPVLEVAERLTMTVTPVLADQLDRTVELVGDRLRIAPIQQCVRVRVRTERHQSSTRGIAQRGPRHRPSTCGKLASFADELSGDVQHHGDPVPHEERQCVVDEVGGAVVEAHDDGVGRGRQ